MTERESRGPGEDGHDEAVTDRSDAQGGVEGGAESGAVPATRTRLEHRIFTIRGHRVMLDVDLAAVYRVLPKRLNQQVKRNRARFPSDFVFQLTANEVERLRLQNATTKRGRGGRRSRPYAFTEHGAVMLASVLKSAVAVDASIQVVRAFVRLRALAEAHKELAEKLDALEAKYDDQFRVVFEAIRQLMAPPPKPRETRIGFHKHEDE
jgi:ORF6N domain-containing protein